MKAAICKGPVLRQAVGEVQLAGDLGISQQLQGHFGATSSARNLKNGKP